MTRDEQRAALLEVARRVAYAAFDGGGLVVVEPIVDDYLAQKGAEHAALRAWIRERWEPGLAAEITLRASIDERVRAEREACAALCDDHASCEGIAEKCAATIRARSGGLQPTDSSAPTHAPLKWG